MEQDDVPIGHVLTRRDALAVLGASGIALLGAHRGRGGPSSDSAHPLSVCVVRPEQTEARTSSTRSSIARTSAPIPPPAG